MARPPSRWLNQPREHILKHAITVGEHWNHVHHRPPDPCRRR